MATLRVEDCDYTHFLDEETEASSGKFTCQSYTAGTMVGPEPQGRPARGGGQNGLELRCIHPMTTSRPAVDSCPPAKTETLTVASMLS